MSELLGRLKGEIFNEILVYQDKVVLKGGNGKEIDKIERDLGVSSREIELRIDEVDCLHDLPCHDPDCRYFTNFPEINNCLLNIERQYTLEEIGQLVGLSRERVRQLLDGTISRPNHPGLKGALGKFGDRLKRITRAQSSDDMFPDPPYPIIIPQGLGKQL